MGRQTTEGEAETTGKGRPVLVGEEGLSGEGSGMAIDAQLEQRQMFLRQMVDMAVD